jgi:hypothetical protein
LIPADDVPTNYLKVSDLAYADTLFWVANATDPYVPYAKLLLHRIFLPETVFSLPVLMQMMVSMLWVFLSWE